ncbi:hypothetical protein HDE_03539 [Halotydeus destructor]|nr:hypothetical protein HDE_03539 [Halotydeus destructor]
MPPKKKKHGKSAKGSPKSKTPKQANDETGTQDEIAKANQRRLQLEADRAAGVAAANRRLQVADAIYGAHKATEREQSNVRDYRRTVRQAVEEAAARGLVGAARFRTELYPNRVVIDVLSSIQVLHEMGYYVELNVHSAQYAIFAGPPSRQTYIGHLNQMKPQYFVTVVPAPEPARPARHLQILPDLVQDPTAARNLVTVVDLPAGARVKKSGLLQSCGYTVVRNEADPANDFMYDRSGHFQGFVQAGQQNGGITLTDSVVPIIYARDVLHVYCPQLVRDQLYPIPGTPEGFDYFAFWLEDTRATAVWELEPHDDQPPRLTFLGFVSARPHEINLRRDYLCTLRRFGRTAPLDPDYPLGVQLYPWRHQKKASVGFPEPIHSSGLVPIMTRLDQAGVRYQWGWSTEDGFYKVVDEVLGIGGFVFDDNVEFLFDWDGVNGYLEDRLSLDVFIAQALEAQAAEEAAQAADALIPAFQGLQLPDDDDDDATNDADNGQQEPEAVVLLEVEGVFGKDTFFVGTDVLDAFNPLRWPKVLGFPEGEYHYDWKSGNVEVKHDPAKKFATGYFYNTEKRRNCYAFSVKTLSGDKNVPLDLVWNRSYLSDLESLQVMVGYRSAELIQHDIPVPMQIDLTVERNRKLIAARNGNQYYLSVMSATDNGTKTAISGMDGRNFYALAVGAANRSSLAVYDVSGITGQYKGNKRLIVKPGLEMATVLFGAAERCETVDRLARTTESYGQCAMWKLVRNSNDLNRTSLPMFDIGIRAPAEADYALCVDEGEAELLKQATLVRLYIAWVPDDEKERHNSEAGQADINVVSVQDVHPVEGEWHVVYLLHHRGKFFSQQIFGNVVLLHVSMSGMFKECFIQICGRANRPKPVTKSVGVSPALEATAIKARGYYNEFWKNVCDPSRVEDGFQRQLYARWQHFYQHDFLGFNYLAKPIGMYNPEQIHYVNVNEMLVQNYTMNLMFLGRTENLGEKVFLSGAFDDSQSIVGAPFVEYRHYMVQVEVPEQEGIRCVIYDFQDLNQFRREETIYDRHSENKAKAIFAKTGQLEMKGNIPERLYFPDIEVNGSHKTFNYDTSQSQEGSLKRCNPTISYSGANVDTGGCIQLNLFYFVSHVGIADCMKVGVANLPFNCRAFVTHSESLCDLALMRPETEVQHWVRHPLPDKAAAITSALKAFKYPMRGLVWQNKENKIVGIVDGNQSRQLVAQGCFFRDHQDPKPTQVAMINQMHYEEVVIQPKADGNPADEVNEFPNIIQTDRRIELTHYVRQVSSPIFDVAKGFPVHGFYRQWEKDDIVYDPVFYRLMDNFYAFWSDHRHEKTDQQSADIASKRYDMEQRRGKLEAKLKQLKGNKLADSNETHDFISVAAILSASAALYAFL